MKLSELSEDFKQYVLSMSNGSSYVVSGKTKEGIIKSATNWVELDNGSTVNKAFIVEFKISIDATRDFVERNKNKLIKK